MQQVVKKLVPLLMHAGFCLLSALILRYALGSGNYALLIGPPAIFLTVVLPVLYFGWPPPFGYIMEPFERIPRRRFLLVSIGALLIGYAVFSSVTFGSPLLGLQADIGTFAVGAVLLYVAHKHGRQLREQRLL